MRHAAESEYLEFYETTSVEDAEARIKSGWVLVGMTTAALGGTHRHCFQLGKPVHPAVMTKTATHRSRSPFRSIPV